MTVMKFIKLESRGGNYLVVAQNVAWLRAAENGQTTVGIVGGQPLLVVGSIEEVAAKIMAEPAPVPLTVAAPTEPLSEPEAEEEAEPASPEPDASVDLREPSAAPATPMPVHPQPLSARSGSLWERPAAPGPKAFKVKATSQRMMGRFE
jgi:hypothetical protein